MATPESNKEVVRQYVAAFNRGDVGALRGLFTPERLQGKHLTPHTLEVAATWAVLTRLDIDVVLSGHKHVPFFWGLNGILVANSGTATTRRIRGLTPSSWNELQ